MGSPGAADGQSDCTKCPCGRQRKSLSSPHLSIKSTLCLSNDFRQTTAQNQAPGDWHAWLFVGSGSFSSPQEPLLLGLDPASLLQAEASLQQAAGVGRDGETLLEPTPLKTSLTHRTRSCPSPRSQLCDFSQPRREREASPLLPQAESAVVPAHTRMMAERKRKFFDCKSMFLNPFSLTQVSLPLPHTSL